MSAQKLAFSLVAIFFLTSAVFADDPPSRVLRLSYMSGQVSVQPGGVDEWAAGVLNRPLTTADHVWSDRDSRAELHLGSAVLRLNSETGLVLSNISDNAVQVELDQGTLNLHIFRVFDNETYEVDTPNAAFTIVSSGEYRFGVDPDADTTTIVVWKGDAEVTGSGPAVRIRSRQMAVFTQGQSLAHTMDAAPGFDGFDDWCRVRDDAEDRAALAESARYVSPNVVGYEDLDAYGQWAVTPEYGPMWVPAALAPDWAPYRFGRWLWVAPWGWTWVDDAPWGFAPFHYGRWVHWSGRWGWCPGPVVARPYYAPALVAWIGSPHGPAWFPLGFREPYTPPRPVSRRYFENVNTGTIPTPGYINRRVPGAVTVVPQQTLVSAGPVGNAFVPVPPKDLDGAQVINGPAVPPARNSLLGSHTADPVRMRPPRPPVFHRAIVSKPLPPAPTFAPAPPPRILPRPVDRPTFRPPESHGAAQPPQPPRHFETPRAPEQPRHFETPRAPEQPRHFETPRPRGQGPKSHHKVTKGTKGHKENLCNAGMTNHRLSGQRGCRYTFQSHL